MIYKNIILSAKQNKKQFAILIDPDKHNKESLIKSAEMANAAHVDFILIGGSLVTNDLEISIEILKKNTNIPILLFPGSLLQISDKADGILLLSLISGRNSDFLIGNHVVAAPLLKKTNLEIISTGYILVESGITTSVEYMSNSKPIPHNKADIAAATAIAGEMLGNKIIYLEAGSGAPIPVSSVMIAEVKKNITIPLIVGGGIKTTNDIIKICKAGADIIITGTAIEHNLDKMKIFSETVHGF